MSTATVKPIRPGTIIEIVGQTTAAVPPTFAETVAVPGTHDWGLENVPQICTSYNDYIAKYGSSDTQLRRSVLGAFIGQGLPNTGGAGAVVVHRMVAAAGAKASVTIQNTTPTNALTLTAKYKGARGNKLSVTVTVHPTLAATKVLTILCSDGPSESFEFAQTNIAALATDVNLRSSYVTATSLVTGVALATVSSASALTGGVDGSTYTGTEVATVLAALVAVNFSVLAFSDLTDAPMTATVVAWVKSQNAANQPVMLVLGGGSSDTMATAITRAATAADQHVLTLGKGVYTDSFVNADLSTAQLAARIAGVLVARGISKALTFAPMRGLTVASGSASPTDQEIKDGIQNGVISLSLSTSALATLKVEKGVTTFIDTTDANRPIDVFSDPRLIRILDLYVKGMKQWGDDVVIGNVPVNDDSRASVYGEAKRRQDELEAQGLIVPGTGYVVVPVTTDDQLPYSFGWQFTRTANYVRGQGTVR